MWSITVTILHALIAQAAAKDLMANIDMDDLADKFIDKLIDRLSGTTLDDADLDQTSLATLGLRQPMLSRGATRFPAMPRHPVQALRASQRMKDLPQASPNKLDAKGMSKKNGHGGHGCGRRIGTFERSR